MAAGAWQDDALNTLAAKASGAEDKPMQGYLDENTLAYASDDAKNHLLAGYDLWLQEVPELLRRVAETGDATLRSPHGFTALQAACLYGDAPLIEALLEAHAEVDACPDEELKMGIVGGTPLALLLCNEKLPIAERDRLGIRMIERGANPFVCVLERSSYVVERYMLLWVAQRKMILSKDFFRTVLEHTGISVHDLMKKHYHTWRYVPHSLAMLMLERGVNPNDYVGEKGLTLLTWAVQRGDMELVQLALEKGAEVGAVSRYFDRSLFCIPTGAHYQANKSMKDVPDITPERAVRIAELLLDHGADIDALDSSGNGLRIHYGKRATPVAKALCEFFKSRGAVLHPDARRSRSKATHRSKVPNKKIKG